MARASNVRLAGHPGVTSLSELPKAHLRYGSLAEMSFLLAIAGAVLVALVAAAYLVGLCFKSRKVRKGIMIGAIAVYVLVTTCYFRVHRIHSQW